MAVTASFRYVLHYTSGAYKEYDSGIAFFLELGARALIAFWWYNFFMSMRYEY